MSAKTKLYEEIAMERDHVCTGCGARHPLSHSHLVPVGQNKKLELVKDNIQYHCMSIGEKRGCHSYWDSCDFWKLNDAYDNMKYVYSVDPTYFWLKLNHAIDAHRKKFENDKILSVSYKDLKLSATALSALENIKKIAA